MVRYWTGDQRGGRRFDSHQLQCSVLRGSVTGQFAVSQFAGQCYPQTGKITYLSIHRDIHSKLDRKLESDNCRKSC